MPYERYSGTHRPEIKEKERIAQLNDLGLETREEYIENGLINSDEVKECSKDALTKRSKKNICLILVAIFIISIVVGILVSKFMGPGSVIMGLLIGAAVGAFVALLPIIVYLITK